MEIDIAYPQQVRRLEVIETGRRRRWTAEAKVRIVEESLQEGATASAVARRHGIAPSHLFLWRKAYREAALEAGAGGFAPVVVRWDACHAAAPERSRMEVVLGSGRRDGTLAFTDDGVEEVRLILEEYNRIVPPKR